METFRAGGKDSELVAAEFTGAFGEYRRRVEHSRIYWLISAEGRLTRQGIGNMLRMTEVLPLPDG